MKPERAAETDPRRALRKHLQDLRDAFVAQGPHEQAAVALARHLKDVLRELEPQLLGLYWARGSEFNAVPELRADPTLGKLPIALPFAHRSPVEMHYRAWDGLPPPLVDACAIPSCDGPKVTPDVVLVPCLGYTASGFRLGYGGGYFDRWLALHPDVTAVGVAWSVAEMAASAFEPRPLDVPLTLIVTERGVVA